jgi:mRNA interferase HigB
VHIISQNKIKLGAIKHPDCSNALLAWLKLMKNCNPMNFSEMKNLVNSVDKVMDYHIFNIGGNKLRLIAIVDYRFHKIFIKDILTHSEYDKRSFYESAKTK